MILSQRPDDKISIFDSMIRKLLLLFIIIGTLSGMLILLKIGGLSFLTRLAYTVFDASLVLMAISSIVVLIIRMCKGKI